MTGKIEFEPMKGIVPEGSKDGDEFDLVCTFRVNGSKVCLVEMGDVDMPGYSDPDSKPTTRQYQDEAQGMVNSFQGQGYTPQQ